MATFISIVGTKRFMTRNSYWMAHPIHSWNDDYLPYLKDSVKWLERLEKRMLKIYKKYTKLTKADYDQFKNGELWLNAKQALKKGIIDRID